MSISSAERVLAIVVLVAGCNDLFGLDATTTDTDGDGIVDSLDNCPLDPNPIQLDSDHDGIGNVCECVLVNLDVDRDGLDDGCDDCLGPGPLHVDSGGDGIDDGCEPCPAATGVDRDGDGLDDACDPCLLGPPHDEDGDGIADACDNCPTVANPDQASTGDLDAVGDACDPDPEPEKTSRMDGFESRDGTLWLGTVPGWTWANDQLVATFATDPGKRFANISVPGGPFIIETRVVVPAGGQAGFGMSDQLYGLGCTVDDQRLVALTRNYPVVVRVMGGPVPGTGPIRLRFTVSTNPSSASCEGEDDVGGVGAPATMGMWTISGRVALTAGPGTTAFDYLWAAWAP
jgi:Thrombospondin type 3 repeat